MGGRGFPNERRPSRQEQMEWELHQKQMQESQIIGMKWKKFRKWLISIPFMLVITGFVTWYLSDTVHFLPACGFGIAMGIFFAIATQVGSRKPKDDLRWYIVTSLWVGIIACILVGLLLHKIIISN